MDEEEELAGEASSPANDTAAKPIPSAPNPRGKEPSDAPSAYPSTTASAQGLPFLQPSNTLNGRFRIDASQPIPTLDSLNAKAYHVTDERVASGELYALVCERGLPFRLQALRALEDMKSKFFTNVIAHGVMNVGLHHECRYVIILERPPQLTLAALLRQQKTLSERQIIKMLVVPLTILLHELTERKVCHGRIHLDSIYVDKDNPELIKLGECFTEPCGYSQPYYYETRERLTCNAAGKGEGSEGTDFFALGILILLCTLGGNPAQSIEKKAFIEKRLSLGSFNAFIGNRELPTMTEDLLKGLLADNPRDRWGQKQLESWLSGKKYNLLRPAPPREAPRPYIFEDILHFNRKHLAFSIQQHWGAAKKELRQNRLERWIELSVKLPDQASQLARIVSVTGGETGRLPTDDDDLVMKTIQQLDPEGPFRLLNMSTNVTGLGTMLADAFRQNKANEIHLLRRILESDLITTWADMFDNAPGYHASETVWFLEKRRHIFRLKTYGFGLERILYDLNPSLPCLSPLVHKHHVMNLRELLYSLNTVSDDKRRSSDPMDQHIAAFIGSRLDLLKEKKGELQEFPQYRNSSSLRALSILATAQVRIGNPELPILSQWIAERIQPIIDLLHSRTTRRDVKEQIQRVANRGYLVGILKIVANIETIKDDQAAFERAAGRFQRNLLRIHKLNERGTLEQRATEMGHRFAFYLTFLLLTIRVLSEIRAG